MALFKCTKCGHAENTAMAPWIMDDILECSLCHTGKWHDEFERFKPTDDQIGYPYKKRNNDKV